MAGLFSKRITKKVNNNQKKDKKAVVCEVYIDGTLKKAEVIDDTTKSFGIFMHSLVLSSNTKAQLTEENNLNSAEEELEKAISLFSLSRGFDKNLFEKIAPKIKEIDVEPEIDISPTVHLINEKLRVVAKGNPAELLQRCAYVLMDSGYVKLTRRLLKDINKALRTMISNGLKVYAIAIKDMTEISEVIRKECIQSEMTFVAFVGIGVV